MKVAYCCCFGIHKVTSPALSDPNFSDDLVFGESMVMFLDTRSNVTHKYFTNFVSPLHYKLPLPEIDTIPRLLRHTNNTTPAYDVITRCAYVRAGSNNSGEYTFCMLIYLALDHLMTDVLDLVRVSVQHPR